MDTTTLAVTPIPGDNPAGMEARYEPEYTVLLEEIDKLTSLNRTEVCNWQIVCDMGQTLLTSKTKDFQIGCYTANAMSRLRGFIGMADGARLLKELIENYWETGFPVLKRLRRRENAFLWWKDCTEALIKAALENESQSPPFPAQAISELRKNIQELDAALEQVLPDFPPLRPLLDEIDRLPVLPEEGAQPEPAEEASAQKAAPAPEAAPQPAPAPEAAKAKGAAGQTGQSQSQEQKPAGPQPARTEAAPATAASSATSAQPDVAIPEPPAFASTLTENLSSFAQYGLQVADMALKANNADPFGWQLSRIAMWGRLKQLPPAQGRQTSLPAPPTEMREALQLQLDAGKYLNAALAAENLFLSNIWWLDIQFLQAKALEHCGPDYAAVRTAVIGELKIFLSRLPGLQELTFIDGTPLASHTTRQWLESIQHAKAAQQQGSPAQKAIDNARKLFFESKQKAALDALDQELLRSNRTLDRLELRLEQCRLLIQAGQWIGATALADQLMDLYKNLQLGKWSVTFGLEVLTVARQAWEGMGGELSGAKIREIRALMAVLRPSTVFEDTSSV